MTAQVPGGPGRWLHHHQRSRSAAYPKTDFYNIYQVARIRRFFLQNCTTRLPVQLYLCMALRYISEVRGLCRGFLSVGPPFMYEALYRPFGTERHPIILPPATLPIRCMMSSIMSGY